MIHKHTRSFDLFSSHAFYLPSYKGMFVLLGLLAAGAALGGIISLAAAKLLPYDITSTYMMIVIYPIQFLPALLYVSSKSHSLEGFDNVAVPLDAGRFAPVGGLLLAVMAFISTLAAAIVSEPLAMLLPPMPDSLKSALQSLTGGPLWVAVLCACIFAPLFEEWLCRGVIMRGFLKHTSPLTAIVVSAAFFAVIHMNPWQAVGAFILGCLFGLVYWKTGSLKLTMLMHCANNAFCIALSRIPGAEDIETTMQLFSNKAHYGILYALCVALLILFISRLLTTEFKSNDSNSNE